ncbi:MAG: helix-turn-helix domain-containing protein [Nitrospinae bacterium]|nr:helix-turn-helix domain-containing protein [Nitrospinota bacterium]
MSTSKGVPQKLDKKALGRRIREARGTMTLVQFGELLGVAHTTVKRYEEGMMPSPGILMEVARISQKPLAWLLTGTETPPRAAPLPPHRLSEEEYLSVPLIEGKIAAGEPIIPLETVDEWVVLHKRPARRSGGGRDNLVSCRVSGDSMWPYLADGDIVVIDRGAERSRLNEKKVYAVWADGGITAKKVKQEGHTLSLIPLNPAEKIRKVDLRENPSPIVGLVIGAWKDF